MRAERAIVRKPGKILRNQTDLELALPELIKRVLIDTNLMGLVNVQTLSVVVVADDWLTPRERVPGRSHWPVVEEAFV